MVSAIVLAAIFSVVSAFTLAPQSCYRAVFRKTTPSYTGLCRPSATLAASAAPVVEVIGKTATESDQDLLTIVPPNEGFRNTAASGGTEVSIASMNLLAPFYNSLQLPQKTTSYYERWEFLNIDRTQRVPKAIEMAKRTNADVLCLQEIEGGKLGEAGASEGREFTLRDDIREWLAEPTMITKPDGSVGSIEGYDSFVWSPLNPNNKRGDVVGLCIAWRSKKHSLVEWEGYRRGMVCMLQEASVDGSNNNTKESNACFAIANLHLPARPSNVLGRLNTMSKTIRKLSELEKAMKRERPKTTKNTIDGLMVVAGDFNSDQDSVAARLLSHGYTNYGNVRDRNYKAKVTKASASTMSHPYRFVDSYDHGQEYGSVSNDPRFKYGNFRELYAPVTVSLKGRGPGIMDHLFYTTGTRGGKPHQLRQKPIAVRRTNPSQVAMNSSGSATKETLSASILQDHLGKRSKRRKKGETRGGGGSTGTASAAHHSNNSKGAKLRVEAILATVDNEETDFAAKRLKIIHEGLPNVEEGFPSDHLPVGALFSTIQDGSSDKVKEKNTREMGVVLGEKVTTPALEEPLEEVLSTSDHDHDRMDETKIRSSTTANITDTSLQTNNRRQPSGVSASVRRRRASSRTSFGLRRRHNQVLNALTEWLVGRGATSVVLDKPLYKNDLLARIVGPEELKKNLKKKSRAPDMMCVFVGENGEESLVVVEVAVASDPGKVRTQKASKYQDLMELIENSDKSCQLATIVVKDDGEIPEGTSSDIKLLTQLTSVCTENQKEIKAESVRLCALIASK
eukprot:CAMPEP_0116125536 /NCGR_PEP_ID=MMETSP0329-20121206/5860_1 /TAXON_ID=697910 /ORGANISM="Pseudo-nitzschia arenysensis, Strain B593" /LENGTH=792 /DNA_ID=CAMNT_0003619577 /DNA_START=122 /DNA_END=2497 /DNA_ORIENTATION=-